MSIERGWFADEFKGLCTYHGRKFSSEMSDTWFYRMRSRSESDIRKAFAEGRAAHRSMPTLNEVMTYLPRYNDGASLDERPVALLPAEAAINAELWPYFARFSRDVQHPVRAKRLEAFDTWHMTYKGVCHKHRRADLYDAEAWDMTRTIHEGKLSC